MMWNERDVIKMTPFSRAETADLDISFRWHNPQRSTQEGQGRLDDTSDLHWPKQFSLFTNDVLGIPFPPILLARGKVSFSYWNLMSIPLEPRQESETWTFVELECLHTVLHMLRLTLDETEKILLTLKLSAAIFPKVASV
jgi:hypothetical protein